MKWTLLSVLAIAVLTAGCGGGGRSSPSPTAPSGPVAPVIRSISVSPTGVGLENATNFTFSADTNATTPQSTFSWQFGDGSPPEAGSTATHVFSRSGPFVVRLTITNAAGEATSTTTTQIRSLVGYWIATVTGHTTVPANRRISRVDLLLNQSPGPGTRGTALSGSWVDDAGCRFTTRIFGSVSHPRGISVGVESLPCNDGGTGRTSDFYLSGTADEQLNVVTGNCTQGGPNCQFRMVRQ